MAEFPSLPLFTDAYIADTVHLSTIEHGAYLLLLMTCWRSKECRLPNDDKYLCRVTRLRADQWRKMKPVIMEFFDITATHVTQKRLLKERTHVRKVVEQRRQAGLLGGRPKSLKDNNTVKANGLVLSKQNESKPKAPTPTPIPIKEKYTKEFEIFFSEYPNKEDKHAASKNFKKEKEFTTAKHLTECAKVYSTYIEENNKQDYAFKAKNWLSQKIYENYEPVDQNLKMWRLKLDQYKKGKWIKEWGDSPIKNGWRVADHGECPAEIERQFLAIVRERGKEGGARC